MKILKKTLMIILSGMLVVSAQVSSVLATSTSSTSKTQTKVVNAYVSDTTYQNSNYDAIFDQSSIADGMKDSLEKKFNIKLTNLVGTAADPAYVGSHLEIKTNKIGTFNFKAEAYYQNGYTVIVNLKLTVKPDFIVNIPDVTLKKSLIDFFYSPKYTKAKTLTRGMLDTIEYWSFPLIKNQPLNTDGLQYLTHLSAISFENVSDIDPYINKMKDISTLKQINLKNSQVKNFSSLYLIKNLRFLTINNCPSIDLNSVADGLKNSHLSSLDLSSCSITDITQLSLLSDIGIKSITLENNDLTSIAALTNFKTLTNLSVNYNEISDLSPISSLTNLNYLSFDSNKVKDISFTRNLKTLNKLIVDANEISDLSPISSLTNLDYLSFDSNKVKDISFISNLKTLNTLKASGNYISDIKPLSNCSNLTSLDLSNNYIRDISDIKNNTNIKTLICVNNFISDISALKYLKNLTHLECSYNQITDYSPVKAYFNKLIFRDFSLENNPPVIKLKNETVNNEIQIEQGEAYNMQPFDIANNYLVGKYGIQIEDHLRTTEWNVDTSKLGEYKYSGIVDINGYLLDINLLVKIVPPSNV